MPKLIVRQSGKTVYTLSLVSLPADPTDPTATAPDPLSRMHAEIVHATTEARKAGAPIGYCDVILVDDRGRTIDEEIAII